MNRIHESALNEINPNLKLVSRFSGGMSNFTYLVEEQNTHEKFVFRYPGDGANNFVDYKLEHKALTEGFNLGLTPETIYFNEQTGIKLAKYIEGDNLVGKKIEYSRVRDFLKQFHSSNFRSLVNYDHLGRLAKYETLHSKHEEQYEELKAYFVSLFESNLKQYVNKPCHNDSQLANFILTEDNSFILVDFEYAAINDPIYDIACFGNVDLSNALDLLSTSDFDDREDPLLRLYGWRMFQCLQWYNVASYKHEIGLGEKLGIDFNAVSHKYLTLANTLQSLIINLD